jgi:hypothetical protein
MLVAVAVGAGVGLTEGVVVLVGDAVAAWVAVLGATVEVVTATGAGVTVGRGIVCLLAQPSKINAKSVANKYQFLFFIGANYP